MNDEAKPVLLSEPPAAYVGGSPRAGWFAIALCLMFFMQGLVFIPYAGIQTDEALFGMGIYKPVFAEHMARILGYDVPTMMMSYIGALKTWIYAAIFQVWPPSPFSVRVPVLLAGTLTVWLFFLLLRDTAGIRAALAGCALLTFDTVFLLTTTFDWGPVAFQHLLLVSGMLLVTRFYKWGGLINLGAGFFLLGLGLWDKALFVWMLGGLGVATLAVFPRELLSKLSWRNAGVASICFLAGAWPLVAYNSISGLKTFRANAQYSSAELHSKLLQVRLSLEGGVLLGYLAHNDPAPRPGRPGSALERGSVALSDWSDEPRVGLLGIALVLSLALLPWLWNSPARKPMLFALVFLLVTWLQMAFTQDVGGSAHHVVLLWPFPQLIVAVAFTRATRALGRAATAVLAVLIAVVCGSSFLVTNQHLAQLVVRGPTTVWTDAVYPLAEYLTQLPAKRIYVMDWGVFDSLRLLGRGQLPLWVGSEQAAKAKMDENDLRIVHEMLTAEEAVFLGHTEGNEEFTGRSARFAAAAESAGYRKQVLRVIDDARGRPIFEVYRWVGVSSNPTATSGPEQPS
jgi:4-amino-4-deoxy-L-arabinose transferase-like glycosyltransferase